ncbi:hypothetical protein BDV25DRAFT_120305 [Aspergillus avenaceus]|uniref:Uncharacterized protein n=1 Tax=Aspergillus avenaceus TaxID=36643 RepID=A0A5N6TU22_ASPAV|nr:hypothetical protein BDV25DRAFT_120305 [Aspergillus avenaceus]
MNFTGWSNQDIVQVLRPDSEVLESIQTRFREGLTVRQQRNQPIKVTCFREEIPVLFLGPVVRRESAKMYGFPSSTINATHSGISKFPSRRDNGYQRVSGEMLRLIGKLGGGTNGAAMEEEVNGREEENGVDKRIEPLIIMI